MDIDREALLQLFLTDSADDLARLEAELLALETRRDDATIDGVFRIAHTLKGNAAILALDGFARLAHGLEDVLDAVRARRLAITAELTSSLLAAVDALRTMLSSLGAGQPDDASPHAAIEAELARWSSAVRDGDSGPSLPGLTPPVSESTPDPSIVDNRWGPALRLEMTKVDQLLSLASRALVVHGQMGAALLAAGAATAEVLELHQRNDRVLMELQDWVIDARMIPVSTLFRTHARTVRDAARVQQKQARLAIEGERVRVDTGIGESARDVLTHLVRNAVDHGIEPPAVRAARGKNPEGTITLRAAHNGNQVVIQVADDGGGFNIAKIRQRARTLGRANADALSVEEL